MSRQFPTRFAARTLAGACFALAAYAGATAANADVIVRYDFSPHTQTYANADLVDANATATEYRGHGASTTMVSSTHVMDVDGNAAKLASLEAAVTNGVYGEFSVTPNAGNKISLSSLNINMRQDNAQAGESFTVYLRSSTDNFVSNVTDVGSATLVRAADAPAGAYGPEARQFLLTAPAFQNLTGTTTFRLYMVTDINPATSGTQRIRIMPNVVLDGTVAPIPEPATLALTALGGLFMLRRSRGDA